MNKRIAKKVHKRAVGRQDRGGYKWSTILKAWTKAYRAVVILNPQPRVTKPPEPPFGVLQPLIVAPALWHDVLDAFESRTTFDRIDLCFDRPSLNIDREPELQSIPDPNQGA